MADDAQTLVLVTRPEGRRLAQSLHDAGLDCVIQPGLRLVCQATLEGLAAALLATRWCVFVSPRAVKCCGRLLKNLPAGQFVAVGQATAKALGALGIDNVLVAAEGGSDALLADPQFAVSAGDKVTIISAKGGRDQLEHALTQRGATVNIYYAYRREQPSPEAHAMARLAQHKGPVILTATSVKILENIDAMLDQHMQVAFRSWPLVVLSDRIANRARELDYRNVHSTLTTTELALRDKVVAVASASPAR